MFVMVPEEQNVESQLVKINKWMNSSKSCGAVMGAEAAATAAEVHV